MLREPITWDAGAGVTGVVGPLSGPGGYSGVDMLRGNAGTLGQKIWMMSRGCGVGLHFVSLVSMFFYAWRRHSQ